MRAKGAIYFLLYEKVDVKYENLKYEKRDFFDFIVQEFYVKCNILETTVRVFIFISLATPIGWNDYHVVGCKDSCMLNALHFRFQRQPNKLGLTLRFVRRQINYFILRYSFFFLRFVYSEEWIHWFYYDVCIFLFFLRHLWTTFVSEILLLL